MEANERVQHVVPSIAIYAWTLSALLVLTAATFGASRLSLGAAALPVALTIACIKATLVLSVFMHLRWDPPVLRAAVILAMFLIAACFSLSYLDWGPRDERIELRHASHDFVRDPRWVAEPRTP